MFAPVSSTTRAVDPLPCSKRYSLIFHSAVCSMAASDCGALDGYFTPSLGARVLLGNGQRSRLAPRSPAKPDHLLVLNAPEQGRRKLWLANGCHERGDLRPRRPGPAPLTVFGRDEENKGLEIHRQGGSMKGAR